MIAVPGYGLVYGYSWLDWTMFAILYVVTGLGITDPSQFRMSRLGEGLSIGGGGLGAPELRREMDSRSFATPCALRRSGRSL